MPYIAYISTEADDVLAVTPLDSALVSPHGSDDKEPGDETGVYLSSIQHYYTHSFVSTPIAAFNVHTETFKGGLGLEMKLYT